MKLATTLCTIEQAVEGLADEFRRIPALLLTEDDLKCNVFSRLMLDPELARPSESADPRILATSLHAELSWFDEKDRLFLKPDLTVIEPRNLSISRSMQNGVRFPSKGCHFTGNAIILELKFCRRQGGLTRRDARNISSDISKIQQLILKHQRHVPPIEVRGFVIVFAKYVRRAPEVDQLIGAHSNAEMIRLIVKTADFRGVPGTR